MNKVENYQLLDCGEQQKIELFGEYKIIRPCPQAVWKKQDLALWERPDVEFIRDEGSQGTWKKFNKNLPHYWFVKSEDGLIWRVEPNLFGNLGVFTEHWIYSSKLNNFFDKDEKVLNLFSYSGSNGLNIIKNGYQVTAVDSSRQAMNGYVENLKLNHISQEGQRLILEDVHKFVAKEVRRDKKYGSILMDPPSFGRGSKGEVFALEKDLKELLEDVQKLLTEDGKIVLTMHSPRFTVAMLEIFLKDMFSDKKIEVAEIINPCVSGIGLPSGFLAWIGG